MQIMTIKGPLDFETLNVRDVVSIVPNGRKVATEYYLGDELVKRTVTIDVLMPLTSESAQGDFNG